MSVPSGPQETDPPDVDLIIRAGIQILGRILEDGRLTQEDLLRLAAYQHALIRLRKHRVEALP